MRTAIIGVGNVGSTLGKGWAVKGHQIVYGVRNPGEAKAEDVVKATGGVARAATVTDAASAADVVVLAIPWGAAREVIKQAGV